ncbi:hypothetical protein [Micromonospora sp. DT31]|uniref:hypothetical protein n=1 Tax=Micromonospora sp. DT31 TaxID=3393434 RepID=UPI003CEB38D9
METATRAEDRRDDGHGTPRDERAAVVIALRLGWSMADAYHHAQHVDLAATPDRPAAAPAKLSNLTELAGRHRLGMYLDGVDVALTQIAPLTAAGRTLPSTAAARNAGDVDREPLLHALDDLNIEVLRWTMATNHRVGVAYRLGRSLADTVRRGDADQLVGRFGGRHVQISRWLDELASVLPPYSAPVVRRSLATWAAAVGRATVGDPGEAGLAELTRELRNQGDLWQDVLTGGLHPRDLLDEENWAVVARNVIIRDRKLVAQAARGVFWPVLAPLLVVLLAVVGVSAAAAAGSPATRAAVALVGLGAGLTALWRSISTPTLSVAAEVNRPLLDSELVVQMTARINRPLTAARRAGRAGRQRPPSEGGSKYVAGVSRIDLP